MLFRSCWPCGRIKRVFLKSVFYFIIYYRLKSLGVYALYISIYYYKKIIENDLLWIFRNDIFCFRNYFNWCIVKSFDHKMKIHIISTFNFTTFRRNSSMFWKINKNQELIESNKYQELIFNYSQYNWWRRSYC